MCNRELNTLPYSSTKVLDNNIQQRTDHFKIQTKCLTLCQYLASTAICYSHITSFIFCPLKYQLLQCYKLHSRHCQFTIFTLLEVCNKGFIPKFNLFWILFVISKSVKCFNKTCHPKVHFYTFLFYQDYYRHIPYR